MTESYRKAEVHEAVSRRPLPIMSRDLMHLSLSHSHPASKTLSVLLKVSHINSFGYQVELIWSNCFDLSLVSYLG